MKSPDKYNDSCLSAHESLYYAPDPGPEPFETPETIALPQSVMPFSDRWKNDAAVVEPIILMML